MAFVDSGNGWDTDSSCRARRRAKLLHPRRLSKHQPHPLVLRSKRSESSVILLSHLPSNHQQILLALLIALIVTICSNPYHLPASKFHVFLKQPLEWSIENLSHIRSLLGLKPSRGPQSLYVARKALHDLAFLYILWLYMCAHTRELAHEQFSLFLALEVVKTFLSSPFPSVRVTWFFCKADSSICVLSLSLHPGWFFKISIQ